MVDVGFYITVPTIYFMPTAPFQSIYDFLIMYRTYSRWTNYSNPASMSCRITPAPPNFNVIGSVSLFLILGFDLFRPFRTSETNQKNNIEIGGAGGYWITRV